ncbi:nucleoside-diphosphate-sugar epimerase family protein [Plectosphaerella plurivora]|uniref:Nucleoside-diphosphate-sugar epimerase family protein n=1 Tax=Plectosphaerella plurivora TaxID=936078 RepID=A0A9P8VJY5_9PEZI|nr:nucleoside-diphosphate-sugar epimerase family protein [Plectosphaerella plurivora]
MSRTVLICGATGKQGGAVISTLLAEDANINILAVTRNAASASAQRLAQKSERIQLVQGDLADPVALLSAATTLAGGPVWGVFSVQVAVGFGQGGGGELGQGKALVDAALAAGVEFFVYTSVDRHGDRSPSNPTDVPHFIHKHQIEQHLIAQTKGTKMDWTILRPVAFLDNFSDDFGGRMIASAWRKVVQQKPLQLVAVSDIGVFAAKAFMRPEEWKGKAISLAGADLTIDDFETIFKTTTGRELPYANGILTSIILWLVKDLGYMFRWFYEEGYAADIAALKKIHPGLKDAKTWLETESDFRKAQ